MSVCSPPDVNPAYTVTKLLDLVLLILLILQYSRVYSGDDSCAFGSDISGNNWFSVATSNFSSWVSQASGAIAAVWGEDTDFLPAIDGGGSNATDSQLKAFTFEQLKAATFNFRKDMILGKGGFGSVYKGWLKEKVPSQDSGKRRIAVKKLDSNSKQGLQQWQVILFLGEVYNASALSISTMLIFL